MQWVAGLDGCKAGWLVVSQPAGQRELAKAAVFPSFEAICAHLPRHTLIGIDMPIGLPRNVEAGGRAPDRAARLQLGPRRSSVFAVPGRDAVYAFGDYPAACARARETSSPSWAPSKQAYWIFPRIIEIDRALRADPALAERVYEIHPEVAFKMMQGSPLLEPKKKSGRLHEDGIGLRKALLREAGFASALVDQMPPRGAACDDLLDACAVAWSAERIKNHAAVVFPDPPGVDEFGLRVAIWA